MQYKEYRYFYTRLPSREKAVYEAVYDGVLRRQTRFFCATAGVDMDRVLSALLYDCPELYSVREWSIRYTDREISFSSPSPYLYTEEEEKAIEKQTERILLSFPMGQDEFTRELTVHNYLVKNCRYDQAYKSRTGRTAAENHSMIGPLLHGRGVCSGFSRAAQYLLMRMQIPAVYCTGKTKDAYGADGHGWLIVQLCGQHYHLDISHDICLSEDLRTPRYSYFNVTDSEIAEDHTQDTRYRGIVCRAETLNYYRKFGRYYSTAKEVRAAAEALLSSAFPLSSERRFDFRVAPGIGEAAVRDAVCAAMQTSDRAKSLRFSGGALHTYSVTFDLIPKQ